MLKIKTISVYGMGYIGLPTATMIASKNYNVIGVDVNDVTVETINKGKIHIVEPGLEELVSKVVASGNLRATLIPETSDVYIIAVPTPFIGEVNDYSHPKPDLSFIKAAITSISKVLKKDDLIILESTSPAGTTEKISEWLQDLRKDLTMPHVYGDNSDIRIAYCPERVLPGKVINELVKNDRVIGGITETCSKKALEVYKIFVDGKCHITNSKTAEMTKLTENASRDVSIAFANELSIICDKLGINIWELIKLSNLHPRVNILNPGAGVGGHCIAVDPWFIVSENPEDSNLISMARRINDNKPKWVFNKVKSALKNHPKKGTKNILCLGIAFKPDIDDLRESPAKHIVEMLSSQSLGNILVTEPNINELPSSIDSHAKLVNLEEGLKQADIIIVLVKHNSFTRDSVKVCGDQILIDVCGATNDSRL